MSPYSKPSIIQEALNNPEETAADTFFYHYHGLKYPLKKFDPQWLSPMGIGNQINTIFGKDCHIWNTALLSFLRNVTWERSCHAGSTQELSGAIVRCM